VSPPNTEEHLNSERLRADYKSAFEEWAHEVRRHRAAASSPCGSLTVKETEARVAAAEAAYRDSRDRLTDEMVLDSVKE
jgi:hypothetical protein